VRLEGLGQFKNLMTSSGIEPATFRVVQKFHTFLFYLLGIMWNQLKNYTEYLPGTIFRKVSRQGSRPFFSKRCIENVSNNVASSVASLATCRSPRVLLFVSHREIIGIIASLVSRVHGFSTKWTEPSATVTSYGGH
jgi:hypothetical protein